MKFSQQSAETLALQALAWLAATDDLLVVFLAASGMAQQDLRAGAGDPAVLGAVLEFLMQDDAWVVAFCDAHALPYSAPQEARQALPGGAQVHWT